MRQLEGARFTRIERGPSDEAMRLATAIRVRYNEPLQGGWMGHELPLALDVLPELLPANPSGVIEIGSANGVTFAAWASIIKAGPHLSIDLLDATCAWQNRLPVDERSARWSEDIPQCVSVLANSRDEVAHRTAAGLFAETPASFLFVDADHGYLPAKQDFLEYVGNVQDGGLVGFHDVIHAGHMDDCGKVFRQLVEAGHETWLLAQGFGIGLLRVRRGVDYAAILA